MVFILFPNSLNSPVCFIPIVLTLFIPNKFASFCLKKFIRQIKLTHKI